MIRKICLTFSVATWISFRFELMFSFLIPMNTCNIYRHIPMYLLQPCSSGKCLHIPPSVFHTLHPSRYELDQRCHHVELKVKLDEQSSSWSIRLPNLASGWLVLERIFGSQDGLLSPIACSSSLLDVWKVNLPFLCNYLLVKVNFGTTLD